MQKMGVVYGFIIFSREAEQADPWSYWPTVLEELSMFMSISMLSERD